LITLSFGFEMQDSLVYGTGTPAAGKLTLSEIRQQADLWPTTLQTVRAFTQDRAPLSGSAVITGAGTSAYAAFAVAAAWPGAAAIATTDLLVDNLASFQDVELLVSLGRSGDSPESLAVVKRIQHEFSHLKHLAITCNAEGHLAHAKGVDVIALDPRTNDRSLVMTSSFSNLVLAGMALHHLPLLASELPAICARFNNSLTDLHASAAEVAARRPSRIAFLSSGPMLGAAREGALKILEMTAGTVVTYAETYLALRHGPMSFLREDSVVVCFLSSDPLTRRYEEDLIEELRDKRLGYIVGIAGSDWDIGRLHLRIPANAPGLPDALRTTFEIVFAQVLGVELSLRAGLDPDNPSPDGVITRVVQGFRIHTSA
jgi:tagatose-6-phosphate ketose/aldose isomerase